MCPYTVRTQAQDTFCYLNCVSTRLQYYGINISEALFGRRFMYVRCCVPECTSIWASVLTRQYYETLFNWRFCFFLKLNFCLNSGTSQMLFFVRLWIPVTVGMVTGLLSLRLHQGYSWWITSKGDKKVNHSPVSAAELWLDCTFIYIYKYICRNTYMVLYLDMSDCTKSTFCYPVLHQQATLTLCMGTL